MTEQFTETQRQKAGNLLVQREVLCLASDVVEDLMEAAQTATYDNVGIGLEDIENAYSEVCPDCGEEVEKGEDDLRHKCESCGWEGTYPEWEEAEIYEWWFVSGWLADKLAEKGHPLYRGYHVPLWGRCCTGQAIALDRDIQDIALSLDWIRRQVTEEGDPTR